MKIVLPRGRLLDQTVSFLNEVGLKLQKPDTRELIVKQGEHSLLFAKPFDVPVYVEHGAHIGITGKDVVEERDADVFVPTSLPFGKCRMSIATPEGEPFSVDEMDGARVATEFPQIARKFFRREGVNVEVMPVAGSTELAPLAGMADAIMDIVETGTTLRANNLVERRKVMDITALLLVNRVAQKTNFGEINELIAKVREAIRDGQVA